MSGYLMRDGAPLNAEEWAMIDKLVVDVAKRRLVGRRVLPIFGPFGAGVQTVPIDSYEGFGIESDAPIRRKERSFSTLDEIGKNFFLNWQDIEAARKGILPLALGPAGAAAATVALAEDTLVLRGDAEADIDGIMSVEGSGNIAMSDWSKESAFSDITAAIEQLQTTGFPGPYALIVSPAGFARMQRPYAQTGALEISLVRELVADGVHQSPVLRDGEAVLIADGPPNADLAIGVDLSVASLGSDGMDHEFRVFETIALRIKRPDSICTITKK